MKKKNIKWLEHVKLQNKISGIKVIVYLKGVTKYDFLLAKHIEMT